MGAFSNSHIGSATKQQAASLLLGRFPNKPATVAPQYIHCALSCKYLQLNIISFFAELDFSHTQYNRPKVYMTGN